ncbi:MAG: hypothetical protein ABC536_06365 [Candidatus Methanosuratincola petrocarbonis]|nr:hypothetical protein [Synergistales bacterium]
MRKMTAALLVLLVLGVPTAVAAAAITTGYPPAVSSFFGSITPVVSYEEGKDLGIYRAYDENGTFIARLYRQLPENVSLAALRINAQSKITIDPNRPTYPPTASVWVGDQSDNLIAIIEIQVGAYEAVTTKKIYTEGFTQYPWITCVSTRLYPEVKDVMAHGGTYNLTFTPADMGPALTYLKKSVGDLKAVGACPLVVTHYYTVGTTYLWVNCTGLYSMLGMKIVSAVINGTTYKAEGGVILLDGPVKGDVQLTLRGYLSFIPVTKTIKVRF